MKLRYPDFLCIGAQKAGTTWLHARLGQHPQVWLPPLKEIHYFDVLHLPRRPDAPLPTHRIQAAWRVAQHTLKSDADIAAKLQRLYLLGLIGLQELDDEWYGRIFAQAGADQVCGEITPAYALLPDAGTEHIARLNPQTKIIFILRDPIERAWSELRMLGKRAGGPPIHRALTGKAVLAHADYCGTISRFRKHFPDEQFQVLYFDEIAAQPEGAMAKVCGFLQLPFSSDRFRALAKPVHTGASEPIDSESYEILRERLKPTYDQLATLNNGFADGWRERHFPSK
jgi:hypothetical protein